MNAKDSSFISLVFKNKELDMAEITRERAREIVSDIYNQSGGFLTNNERERALADILGAPVREAAAKACTTDTRFLYEMIQNAEDCSYESAMSQGKDPVLEFEVHPNRIVVESNEDGFEESHVRAICSAGRRLKEGKIGEKGLGFKSIFKVASKVQIQSGPFCFSLRHREGENGLGMVAPVNEIHEVLPREVRTRFTLFAVHPEQYEDFGDKLANFPHTIVAFLSKLKTVKFWNWTLQGAMSLKSFNRSLIGSSLICNEHGDIEMTTHEYVYFRKRVTGLPPRESRPVPTDVEMVLAFPVDGQVVSTQPFAHAYLPLRAVGLNFLVQSDFVTQDNREVLAVCPWNDHLLSHLHGVFFAALENLSSMPEVTNIWLRFLPSGDITDPQWSDFYNSVRKHFKHLRVFQTRKGTLKSLEEVRYLLPEHCDDDGDPLFSDTQEDIYLSSQYAEYYDLLRPFGLQPVSSHQLLDRFRLYLDGPLPIFQFGGRLSNVSFHGKRHDEDWHARVALLLLSWMDSPQDPMVRAINLLQVVPVHDVSSPTLLRFGNPKNRAIYFPHDSKGNLIPKSLVDSVPRSMVLNGPRKQLFARLGVKHAEPSLVIERICNWNTRSIGRPSLQESIHNLRYIFTVTPDTSMVNAKCILLYDDHGKVLEMPHRESNKWVRKEDLYFKDERNYGMGAVWKRTQQGRDLPLLFPLQVRFLHPDYTAIFLFGTAITKWPKWLEEVGSIRRAPRLETTDSPPEPSKILLHVVKHAPDILLNMLKANWDVYVVELASASPDTLSAIKQTIVCVECGTESLEKSFLGSPEQKHVWSGTHLKDKFPFLITPSGLGNKDPANWGFLSQFGVTTTTPEFLLASAQRLSRILPRRHAKAGFFKLYELLADNYCEEFWDNSTPIAIVYLSQLGPDDTLVKLADCVWDDDHSGRYVLASHDDYTHNPKVKQMFQRVMSSRRGDWVTLLSKLSSLPKETSISPNIVRGIYKAIMEGSQNDQDWQTIRVRFRVRDLIYIPHKDAWHPPSRCAWSACSSINGKYGIRHLYPDLERLFVDRLSISVPDIHYYVEHIQFMVMVGNISTSEMLIVIKELIARSPTPDDLEPLKLLRFLPVRTSTIHITYRTVDEPFFIIDDDRLQVDPGVPVLDFTPEDVCRLRAFFSALGLQTRYISSQLIEGTCAVSDVKESAELTHELRLKSESLYRCTIHYGSTKSMLSDNKAQELFSRATVYTAVGFQRHFSLEDGLATEISQPGRLHLDEIDSILRIYVPGDERQRAICYATELPQALVRYLKIDDQAACGTFATVLREPVEILDEILNDKGIIRAVIKRTQGLVIHTKSQLESKEVGSDSTASSNPIQPAQQSLPIILKASESYLQKNKSSLSYLTTLTKKYNITRADIEHDLPSVAFDYFKTGREKQGLTVTEAALQAAAESNNSGEMALLLEAQGQAVAIPEAILKSAAENEMCGREVMTLLLNYLKGQGRKVLITDAVLKAAAENLESGDALLALLLEYRDNSIWMAEDIVIAAAENEDLGHQIMSLLLNHDRHIWVSPAAFEAAAGNLHQGPELIALLLRQNGDNIRITEDIIITTVHNDTSGLEVLTLLKEHNGGYLPVTEGILVAAAASENCHDIIDLFLGLYNANIPITNAVLETAARNPACNKEHLARLLNFFDSTFQVTDVVLISAMHDWEKVALLLTHLVTITTNSPTGGVLIAAAGSAEWCLEKPLLLELLNRDIPITEAVLEAAAGNPVHGYSVMDMLLEHCSQELQISQGILLAAAKNAQRGGHIMELLLERQPDIQITEYSITAAAATDNDTLEQLIRHLKESPTMPAVQITESLLDTVSGNRQCGARALHLLLDTRAENDSPIPITQSVLTSAARNIQCGYEIMTILLDHGGPELDSITEDVIIAAARNSLWGLEILGLLLDRGYAVDFSVDVFAAAEQNIWSGEEIVAFLLKDLVTDGGRDAESSEHVDFCDEAYLWESDDGSSDSTKIPESANSSEDVYDTADSE
ncbi:hypothetical protein BDW59DRAFT_165856 [Aspergillus cavernicola]|uniref:Protein NO VEIN C-terminal domain-containing protein n=1 Tax=Aspergillus cavernicola TaxID=176166 RepID=A0ABR4HQD4_9EURO